LAPRKKKSGPQTKKSPKPPANPLEAKVKSNKIVIWNHFTDTAFLVVLELFFDFGMRKLLPFVPESKDLVDLVHVVLKWFAFAAIVQFAIDTSIELAIKTIVRSRRMLVEGEK
jgi:hypothetical protein